jgi:preprotein translocase subunit SecG
MYTFLIVVYVLVSVALVGLVLIQHGKGADAGAAFGSGASGTVFGARGSANFLSRTTAWLAAVFFALSLTLAYFMHGRAAPSKSVVEAASPAAPATVEVPTPTPAAPAAQGAPAAAAPGAAAAPAPAAAPAQGAAPAPAAAQPAAPAPQAAPAAKPGEAPKPAAPKVPD